MSLVRVVKTAAATLTRTFYVDETPTDAAGAVTVTVTRAADGSAVTSGTATHGVVGTYAFVLPSQVNLDWLDIAWTGSLGGGTVTLVDRVEIVGGFLFGLAEARGSDASLSSTSTYTTAMLTARRIEVEQECERLTGRSFVPRFRRIALNGTGRAEIATPDQDLRTLRAASVAWVTGETPIALTGPTLTGIVVTAEGILVRPAGIPWPLGQGNVVVEYEYGWDRPPVSLAGKAMVHLRSLLNATRTGLPDRTLSYTTTDGSATYQLAQPTRGTTGIPEVDAVYARYQAPAAGFA